MNSQEQKLQNLKWLEDIGIEYYCSAQIDHNRIEAPKVLATEAKTLNKIAVVAEKAIEKSKKINTTFSPEKANEARTLANQASSLADLKNKLMNFDGCDLKKFATNTVFAEGVENAKVMLIGEAPGQREDQEGRPFCGESGILLDSMLKAIGLSRATNSYITNTVFWRPPANRCPSPEEVEICRPFLEKHIALLNPRLIIMVGSTATTTLLGKEAGVSQVRDKYFAYTNQYLTSPISATAIFHPAYLLRQPGKKKDTWFDLLKIRRFIEQI